MSDAQPAPDWWLASDGKWYPPTSPPGWGKEVEPPSRSLATWLQGTLWAMAGLGLATALTALPAREAAETWIAEDTRAAYLEWSDLHVGANGALSLLAIAMLVFLVLVIIWMWGAHKYESALQPEGRRWSAAWTIAGWLVPLFHLIVPKLVLGEIERIAAAERDDDTGLVADDWRRRRSSPISWLFWVGWIAGSIGAGLSTVFWDGILEPSVLAELDTDGVLAAYSARVVGGLGMVPAGVAGALYFRRLQRLLTEG